MGLESQIDWLRQKLERRWMTRCCAYEWQLKSKRFGHTEVVVATENPLSTSKGINSSLSICRLCCSFLWHHDPGGIQSQTVDAGASCDIECLPVRITPGEIRW